MTYHVLSRWRWRCEPLAPNDIWLLHLHGLVLRAEGGCGIDASGDGCHWAQALGGEPERRPHEALNGHGGLCCLSRCVFRGLVVLVAQGS